MCDVLGSIVMGWLASGTLMTLFMACVLEFQLPFPYVRDQRRHKHAPFTKTGAQKNRRAARGHPAVLYLRCGATS